MRSKSVVKKVLTNLWHTKMKFNLWVRNINVLHFTENHTRGICWKKLTKLSCMKIYVPIVICTFSLKTAVRNVHVDTYNVPVHIPVSR